MHSSPSANILLPARPAAAAAEVVLIERVVVLSMPGFTASFAGQRCRTLRRTSGAHKAHHPGNACTRRDRQLCGARRKVQLAISVPVSNTECLVLKSVCLMILARANRKGPGVESGAFLCMPPPQKIEGLIRCQDEAVGCTRVHMCVVDVHRAAAVGCFNSDRRDTPVVVDADRGRQNHTGVSRYQRIEILHPGAA